MEKALIEVEGLKKYYSSGVFQKSVVRAVDGISFKIGAGETFALVGESGCGKTTVGRCVLRLTEPTGGRVFFDGEDILGRKALDRDMRKRMQIIFQDADGSLNPRMRVYDLILEPFRVHGLVKGDGYGQVCELMETVNLTPDLLSRYPHELSGGQRQRIGIARAVALSPRFIVADEPAASLDLSVQAQMLELMKKLQKDGGISYLYISHNLRIVRIMADRIGVMYLGKLVETGTKEDIFSRAAHPYTRALLSAIPSVDPAARKKRILLEGDLPGPIDMPSGCRFHPRCPYREEKCKAEEPTLKGNGHQVACHLR